MARPARVIVEDDGTVWEPGEEAWAAMEKLTGHEAEDDRAMGAEVRGYATEPATWDFEALMDEFGIELELDEDA